MRPVDIKPGIFRPHEMIVLARVYDGLVRPGDSPEKREQLASRIIANYMAGITDSGDLARISARPLGR